MLFFTYVATVFAVIIAFGVIYNSARIGLTERSRELGSLRALGFTRAEVAYILLGELGLLTLIAIPLVLWLGEGMCYCIALRGGAGVRAAVGPGGAPPPGSTGPDCRAEVGGVTL